MENVLLVKDVRQSFRTGFWMKRAEVLHGVSLYVPRGSIFGFLGANGAGKTTLINLIVGLREPTSGAVTVAGFPASSTEARSKIGYLPERPYFYEHVDGEGLLQYFGALAGLPRPKVKDRIPIVLKEVGLLSARKTELRRYSKGMLQRIGIAQALLHDPEFLVLDEPMSGLDPVGRKEIRELILRLSAEGRTIMFSSHVIPDVEAICDHVALIQKGKLIGAGLTRDFLSQGQFKVEIAFAGVEIGQAKKIFAEGSELRTAPEGLVLSIDGKENTNGALKRILDMNGRVLWVNPVQVSLENLFDRSDGEVRS